MTWIIHALAVGFLLTAAALCLERALRLLGRPVRAVWAGAMVGTLLLPLVALFRPRTSAVAAGAPGMLDPLFVLPMEPVRIAMERGGTFPVSWLLPAIWAAASATFLGLLLRSWLRLREERRDWAADEVDGTPVLVSERRGPGVVGVWRPAIVLPGWVRTLDPTSRRMIVAHEDAHRRAGDTRLLVGGTVAAALVPWNPFLWWQLRRLLVAVEADCDARVLRATGASVGSYGRLLLSVGGMGRATTTPLLALAEPQSTLERRIRIMTEPKPTHALLRAGPFLALGVLAVAGACEAPDPAATATGPTELPGVAATSEDAVSERLPATRLQEEPTFTPFTVRPELRNQAQVGEALEREYPPLLRDAGIGGTTVVWVFADETGQVRETRVHQSSGHRPLDDAALRVANAFDFSPALNRDEPVPVWVQLPITFQPR